MSTSPSGEPQGSLPLVSESLDGTDPGGDHNVPFEFGSRPRTWDPRPFTVRQYGRLLVLRSRIEAGIAGEGDLAPAVAA